MVPGNFSLESDLFGVVSQGRPDLRLEQVEQVALLHCLATFRQQGFSDIGLTDIGGAVLFVGHMEHGWLLQQHPFFSCDKQKCLQTLANVPRG
jgi:hypothetical protein